MRPRSPTIKELCDLKKEYLEEKLKELGIEISIKFNSKQKEICPFCPPKNPCLKPHCPYTPKEKK